MRPSQFQGNERSLQSYYFKRLNTESCNYGLKQLGENWRQKGGSNWRDEWNGKYRVSMDLFRNEGAD